MTTSTSVPVHVTPEAAARIADLGLEEAMRRMIDYARQHLPEPTRIEVVLYERDVGEQPGIAIEVYTPFDSFDPTARTAWKIVQWRVSEFPPQVLEHLMIDYQPEAPNAG